MAQPRLYRPAAWTDRPPAVIIALAPDSGLNDYGPVQTARVMIVTCSACKTRYLTDPAALGAIGRMVRCAKCGHTWMQTPPADSPRRVDVISPASGQADLSPPRFNLPAPYIPPRRRRSRLRTVLAVAAVVVVAVVGAGYFARSQIIETWPQAKRVYDLIGIGGLVDTSSATLDVGNLRIVHRPVDGMEVLVLQGEITNRGQQPQAVRCRRQGDHGLDVRRRRCRAPAGRDRPLPHPGHQPAERLRPQRGDLRRGVAVGPPCGRPRARAVRPYIRCTI
jgi:predicted Zn finger-like uncharacterized protein